LIRTVTILPRKSTSLSAATTLSRRFAFVGGRNGVFEVEADAVSRAGCRLLEEIGLRARYEQLRAIDAHGRDALDGGETHSLYSRDDEVRTVTRGRAPVNQPD